MNDLSHNQLSSYDFTLPADLIAQFPLSNRSQSRLLYFNKDRQIQHYSFSNIINLLQKNDVLVVNDTKVIPARLCAKKENGTEVEVLLSRQISANQWTALISKSKRLHPGCKLIFSSDKNKITATVIEKIVDEPGAILLNFDENIVEHAEEHGNIPLPPYLNRTAGDADKNSYQTVYADNSKKGAVAAPTAGLHFDDTLLKQIQKVGVKIVKVTLHVGAGTFLPVRTDDINKHQMHYEKFELSADSASILNNATANNHKIVAVGSTSTRLLETCYNPKDKNPFTAKSGLSGIFIKPGYKFRAVDAIITNFHLPKSTLIMMVAAAIGLENTMKIYNAAIALKYRFYSYGDAMFIYTNKN